MMSDNIGKIKIKSLNDLITNQETTPTIIVDDIIDISPEATPAPRKQTKSRKRKVAASTTKKAKLKQTPNPNNEESNDAKTPGNRKARSSKRGPPPNQLRIDSFFKSASKSFKIPDDVIGSTSKTTSSMKNKQHLSLSQSPMESESKNRKSKVIARKRLYLSREDINDESNDSIDDFDVGKRKTSAKKRKSKSKFKSPRSDKGKAALQVSKEIIDLCSDSEEDNKSKEISRGELTDKAKISSNQKNCDKTSPGRRDTALEKTPADIKNNLDASTRDDGNLLDNLITPQLSEQTPMFSIPSALATTKRCLRNMRRNAGYSSVENTPAVWKGKLRSQDRKQEENIELEGSSKGKEVNDSLETPQTALESLSTKQSKTSKRNNKGHKRKISFSAMKETPVEQSTKGKSKARSIKDVTKKTENLEGIKPLDEDSREGVFDLSFGNSKASIKSSPGLKNDEMTFPSSAEKPIKEVPSVKIAPDTLEISKVKDVDPSSTARKRKPRPVPPFKIVNGTSFAVDAFCYGYIEGVTHYFLSHYHADHYMGLTRKFAMPLYASPITARLIQAFTPIDEQYLYILELNEPQIIDGIEVTAIDANHCPGAIMFVFKLPNGKCMLHTGDFRASPDMESEPIFWNNDIDTIYLDTTYISDKYAFCTQYESIDKAIDLIREFRMKHLNKRILYVCGAYVIGKEKFWLALVEEFGFKKVWTEPNRRKAFNAMQHPVISKLLCDNPKEAELHVIALGKLNYQALKIYFEDFQNQYDIVLALRPSGWEKNAKPQYRGLINILGIEYSEHSSYDEMKRFVKYLKPKNVISTVAYGGYNSTKTPTVPQQWYKYDKLCGREKNFQTSISYYFKTPGKNTPKTKEPLRTPIRPTRARPITNENLVETVSPLKSSPMVLVGTPHHHHQHADDQISDRIILEDENDFIIKNISENEEDNDEEHSLKDQRSELASSTNQSLCDQLDIVKNEPFHSPVISQLNSISEDAQEDWVP